VRENKEGKLFTLVYNSPCAVHIDPIEKKPLYHFLPKTYSLSIATVGCNLRCIFCQNWTISQRKPEEVESVYLSPKEIVTIAKARNCKTISFTYSEPNVFYEYVLDIAKLAHKEGIKTIMVTAGFINEEPLRELLKYIDAANIDLKGDETFYQKMCNATLAPIKRVIKVYKEMGVHIEITNLIIPTKNDSLPLIRDMCKWIKTEIDKNTPLHFSRFFPHYKLKNLPPTPLETLEKAYKIAKEEGLNYVYIGNVRSKYENTYCHNCDKLVVKRVGYFIPEINIQKGKCKFCNSSIPGVWE